MLRVYRRRDNSGYIGRESVAKWWKKEADLAYFGTILFQLELEQIGTVLAVFGVTHIYALKVYFWHS